MNILQVNKFWFQLGGVESYLKGVVEELSDRGHRIAEFGMRHEENRPSEYADFFVPFIDLRTGGRGLPLGRKIRTSVGLLYDPKVFRRISDLCAAFGPEVAHVHLFERQLTTAVIRGLRSRRVPILQTFHDYSFVCPSYTLMKGMTVPCELECTRRGYHRAVVHRCVKRSRAASSLSAVELIVRRHVVRYQRWVDLFIAPSRYLRAILIESGLEPRKVVHVPNYVKTSEFEPRLEPGEYALFVGRLSFEKGLWTLLAAAEELPTQEFRIVGRGPEEEALRAEVRRRGLSNVRLEGFRQGEELRELYRNASCVVMPSEWPENSPMVVYEAFSSGKPVVATALGGLPELIDEGRDGFVVPPADAGALSRAIRLLAESPQRAREMGERGREKVVREYDLARHADRLLEIYDGMRRGRVTARPAAGAVTRAVERSTAEEACGLPG